MDRIEVDARALSRVLNALLGNDYEIRELQAMRHMVISNETSPITILVDEYNEAVRVEQAQRELAEDDN